MSFLRYLAALILATLPAFAAETAALTADDVKAYLDGHKFYGPVGAWTNIYVFRKQADGSLIMTGCSNGGDRTIVINDRTECGAGMVMSPQRTVEIQVDGSKALVLAGSARFRWSKDQQGLVGTVGNQNATLTNRIPVR